MITDLVNVPCVFDGELPKGSGQMVYVVRVGERLIIKTTKDKMFVVGPKSTA